MDDHFDFRLELVDVVLLKPNAEIQLIIMTRIAGRHAQIMATLISTKDQIAGVTLSPDYRISIVILHSLPGQNKTYKLYLSSFQK